MQPQSAPTTPAPLAPAARFPLHAEADGSVWSPRLQIIPTGPTLVVEQPRVVTTWFDSLIFHAPTAAAVLLLVTGLWLIGRVWRTRRRRQTPGVLYCRRCNYELATPAAGYGENGRPAWVASGGRCSECGSAAAPVRGRSAAARLFVPVAAAVMVSLACVAALAVTVRPLGMFGAKPWPFSGAEKVLGPFALGHVERGIRTVHSLELFDLPSRQQVAELGPFEVGGNGNGTVTPDGKRFVYLANPTPSPGWSVQAVIADLETGRQVSVLRDPEEGVSRALVGAAIDGRLVYIQSYHFGMGSEYRESLQSVDTLSGAVEDVGEVSIPYALGTAGSRYATNQVFLVDAARRWTLLTWGGPAKAGELMVHPQTGEAFTVTVPAFSSLHALTSVSGKAIDVMLWPSATSWRIDLAARSVAPLPAAPGTPVGRSASGRLQLRAQGSVIAVVEIESGAAVAVLSAAGGSPMDGGVVSDDGRFVACPVLKTGAGGQDVLVWELPENPAAQKEPRP